MGKSEYIINRINRLLDRVAQFTLIIVMMLVVINIVLRAFFGKPILGTYELVGFLFAVVVSLSIAYCAFQNGHIAVDFLAERFPIKIQIVSDIILKAIALVFFAIATWTLVNYGISLFNSGEVSPSAKIPFYYFVFIIAVGFAMLCVELFIQFKNRIKDLPRKWTA